MDSTEYTIKLVLLGDKNIGKTSIIEKYIYGNLNSIYSTEYIETYTKNIKIGYKKVKLIIFDIGSQDLINGYLPSVDGVVYCFDTTDLKTLKNLYNWISKIKKIKKSPVTCLVGTKNDTSLFFEKENIFEMEKFKNQNNIDYAFISSAKSNQNIDLIFEILVSNILAYKTTNYTIHEPKCKCTIL